MRRIPRAVSHPSRSSGEGIADDIGLSSEESEEEVDMGRTRRNDANLADQAGPSRLPMEDSFGENTGGGLGRSEGEEELGDWGSEDEREVRREVAARLAARRARREARSEHLSSILSAKLIVLRVGGEVAQGGFEE